MLFGQQASLAWLLACCRYATTIRDSKQHREQNFLKRVKECVQGGGKVLIPVFALGRAQELCILLDTFWERMNLRVPIYFAAGMTERANEYYKLFINWTNQVGWHSQALFQPRSSEYWLSTAHQGDVRQDQSVSDVALFFFDSRS